MDIHEAQRVMKQKSKELWEKDLHPNGFEVEYYVHDKRGIIKDLPNIGITLYANGTWEFTDPSLRDEEVED